MGTQASFFLAILIIIQCISELACIMPGNQKIYSRAIWLCGFPPIPYETQLTEFGLLKQNNVDWVVKQHTFTAHSPGG
jgi:hypothetical protein